MTVYGEDKEARRMPDRRKSYALLVDGYVKDLFTTGMIFQRLNYEVYITNSGEDALRIIGAALPELVITELSLQQMSGLELLARLKHDPETREIPVIVQTAIGDQKREEHCRASGCSAFLKKPADLDELYCAIQSATQTMPRRHIRLRTLLPVSIGGQVPSEAADSVEFVSELSENGIFVRTMNPRPVDTVLPVNLIIQSMAVKFKAAVVRKIEMNPGLFKEPGMGMRVVEISDTSRELLRNFIKGQIMKEIATA
jgi:CheY-like chemotaxis protein